MFVRLHPVRLKTPNCAIACRGRVQWSASITLRYKTELVDGWTSIAIALTTTTTKKEEEDPWWWRETLCVLRCSVWWLFSVKSRRLLQIGLAVSLPVRWWPYDWKKYSVGDAVNTLLMNHMNHRYLNVIHTFVSAEISYRLTLYAGSRCYRAMHFSANARSWDRMSSVCLSVCL